ncbi:hypothetical protein [Mucilaginibacter segetis]|uniref:GLPGLI family protein n=1 Tax=Mucilaginibacter segetis TaxID=2793071 RepID=A0A934PV50_9SPHI|nr:hypothetical protein [Mucilaginibacter segetis]MBK0380117.1 hypothetical protein [Mucilaginibacter segetis]
MLKQCLKGIIAFIFFYNTAFAQMESPRSPFVFSKFISGTVLQKDGGVVKALLDYNTITQEMMFDNNGKKLVLDKETIGNIDTLYFDSRKFIPARAVFFERLTNTPVTLYIQYKNKAVNSKATIGAGGGSNNSIGGFIGVKQTKGTTYVDYDMTLPENYELKSENVFWLQKKGVFYEASNLKKVEKLFSEKSSQIESFVKENNIDLNKIEDFKKLIVFCNQ